MDMQFADYITFVITISISIPYHKIGHDFVMLVLWDYLTINYLLLYSMLSNRNILIFYGCLHLAIQSIPNIPGNH